MAQRQFFRLTDFTGGWNPDQSAIMIDDSEATLLRNFRLDKVGSLVTRRGLEQLVDPPEPGGLDPDIVALGRVEPGDVPTFFEAVGVDTNGNFWKVDNGVRSVVPIPSSNPTQPMNPGFLTTQAGLIYTSANDHPKIYRPDLLGGRVVRMGVTAPDVVTASPHASQTSMMNGTYEYAVTVRSAGERVESAPALSGPVTTSSRRIVLNITTSSVAGNELATHYRIYRTLPGGAVFLFVAEVPFDNSLVYVDGADDSTLRQPAVNFEEGPPLDFEQIVYHRGYYFASKGRTLYWSRYENPHSWPPFNNTEVPFGAAETVTALASFQDALLIFSRNNTVLLAGSGGNWSLARQDVDLGCVNQHAMVELDRGLAFLSERGVFSFPGFEEVVPKLNRLVSNLPANVRGRGIMTSVPEERALWLTLGSVTYCIHLLNAGLSTYSFAPAWYLTGGRSKTDLPWMLFPDKRGVIRYGGTTDLGEPINALYKSKIFQLQNPEMTKHFRRIGAFATQGSESVVTITISDRFGEFSLPLTGIASGDKTEWGFFVWDEGVWAEEGIGYFIGSLPAGAMSDRAGLVGMTVQITLSASTEHETEIVPPITMEYRESGRFLGG